MWHRLPTSTAKVCSRRAERPGPVRLAWRASASTLKPILALVLMLAGTWLAAAEDDPPSRDAARRQALSSIRAEIARLQTSLEHLSARETSLGGRLERTETELRLQQQRLAEAKAEREVADQRLAASAARLAELETAFASVRADLAARLAGLYRLGRGGYLRLALSIEPGAPMLPAMRQLRVLARRDREALDRYRQARERVAIERAQRARLRSEAENWQAEQEQRRAELASVRQRQLALLGRVRRQRRAVAARTSALEDKERRLATFIGALMVDARTPLAGRSMGGFKGILDWPVRGPVRVPFGPRRDPRYRTEVPHNGIDIATQPGDPVRVVYPGQVLYAAPFEGFGETVVVHHPGQILSLYAGLAAVRVARDDVLRSETVIGTAAVELYFEIRHENRPEDPLTWLR